MIHYVLLAQVSQNQIQLALGKRLELQKDFQFGFAAKAWAAHRACP